MSCCLKAGLVYTPPTLPTTLPWSPWVPPASARPSCCGGAAAGDTVFLEEGHAAEGARAHATLVLLHLCVSLEVCTQVGAVSKCPVTMWAGKWTLP